MVLGHQFVDWFEARIELIYIFRMKPTMVGFNLNKVLLLDDRYPYAQFDTKFLIHCLLG